MYPYILIMQYTEKGIDCASDHLTLRKLIIGFKNVYDHKGSTISKVLLDCLEEWDIKRVYGITVDNATANSSALRRFLKLLLRKMALMHWLLMGSICILGVLLTFSI